MQSSKGMIKLIIVIEVKIIIKGKIIDNIMDIYLKVKILSIFFDVIE